MTKRYRCQALAMALLGLAGTAGSQPVPEQGAPDRVDEQRKASEEAARADSGVSPVIEVPSKSDEGEHAPDQHQQPVGEAEQGAPDGSLAVARDVRDATDWLARFAGAQTAILALTLFAVGMTLRSTNRTLELTRQALRETETTTLAARETVEIAQASERAYLHTRLTFAASDSGRVSDRDVLVDLIVENVGRTPAHDVVIAVWRIDHYDDPRPIRRRIADRRLGTIGAGTPRQAGRTSLDAYAVRDSPGPQFTFTSSISYRTVFGTDEGDETEKVTELSVRPGGAEGVVEYELLGQFHITTISYEQTPGAQVAEMLGLNDENSGESG